MTSFHIATVSWDNITAYNAAQSSQAQENLQAAFARGRQARNYAPQSQDSLQEDTAESKVDSDIHIPRAEVADPEDTSTPASPDVVLIGEKLHATNDNQNVQYQVSSQDAVMDTPLAADDAYGLFQVYGAWDGVPVEDPDAEPQPRPGANNVAEQVQSNLQNKSARATTKTRLIELADYPERRRAGSVIDLADVRAGTTALNEQVQDLGQNAVINEQYGPHAVRIGSNNIGAQVSHSGQSLGTEASVVVESPVESECLEDPVGTGSHYGDFTGVSARGQSSNKQTSVGRQVALDQNICGADGEAFNVLPQVQTNEQLHDTRATVDSNPRAFTDRDDAVTAVDVEARTATENSQVQANSQAAEVTGFGPASNDAPQQQSNHQAGVTVTTVNIVL